MNNKLVCVTSIVEYKYMDSFVNYLTERYLFFPEEIDAYTYAGLNGLTKETSTTFVTLELQGDNGLAATYMPISVLSTSSKSDKRNKAKGYYSTSDTEVFRKAFNTLTKNIR